MQIGKATLAGTGVIFATVAAAALFVGAAMATISVGGPISNDNQQASDLVADILPPPVYILESYLEARLAMAEPQQFDHHAARLKKLHSEFDARQRHWAASTLPDDLKAQVHNVDAPARRFYTELEQRFLPSLKRGDEVAARQSVRRLAGAYADHRREIDRLVEQTSIYQAATRQAGDSYVTMAFVAMAVAGLILLLVLAAANLLLRRHLVDPLKAVSGVMWRMAEGDLGAEARLDKPMDEIADMMRAIEVFRKSSQACLAADVQAGVVRELTMGLEALASRNLAYRIAAAFPPEFEPLRISFNSATETLCSVVTRTASSASNVLNGSAEIRSASGDLAQRTEQQAANIEESAAAMREVTGMVQQTAKNAFDVGQQVSDAHGSATEGGIVVTRAVEAMGHIQKSANEITSIIDVIDGIAFQTNLLALNAGVEAARAGESGKGFAVVANEVRALAQRSADAASDIKALIGASHASVAEGVALVDETGTVLMRIGERVAAINDRIAEIADSAQAQALRLQQVNQAVSDMDKMTQQNAAMVEQSNAAARSLADEANDLARLVEGFDTGQRASRPASRPAHANHRPALVTGNLALKADPDNESWSSF
ncbi:methyl-accepting chemotaxis protein [Blastomonas natatoria]|uniref:Methyl-accepting chemotaxis protein n=2 Tax=Blastomonas natatoria TaxID=34015 RepID=A0A2V3UVJ7_9SPHN|nr:methyl-accepting chemotaxis protein [Blastomonas natatoria]